ncbi:hypothetical protein JADG_008040 [Aureobasidium aubasidani]|nr:hypothetical protein JADG_008040 [Aureobasidium pullulans]
MAAPVPPAMRFGFMHLTGTPNSASKEPFATGASKFKRAWPEPFIWYMFRSLARACLAMEKTYNGTGMVHGDLQAGNFFFGEENPDQFGIYPVADFGSAREILPNVKDRSDMGADPCCPEYAPPELAWDLVDDTWEVSTAMNVSGKTNIYQVGMLMACTMRLEPSLPENNWRLASPGYSVPLGEQLHHNAKLTGQGVQELLKRKLNYYNGVHPKPTARRLLALINAHAIFDTTRQALARGAPIPAALRKHKIALR